MPMPERTLVHLLGWMKRNGCEEEKIKFYEHNWRILEKDIGLQAPGIPCPKCYMEMGSLKSALSQIGKIAGTNVYHLKCPICAERFSESVELDEDVFDSILAQDVTSVLAECVEYEDLWLTKNNGERVQLTPELIEFRLKTGFWK